MTSVGSLSAPALSSKIAIPDDVDTFAATVSPRGVDLEDRLDCSLDALIKERRKEHKLAKKSERQEEAAKAKRKHDRPQQQKKAQQQRKQQQVAGVKHGQAQKRKALVNKNRGLPALPSGKHTNQKNGGKQPAAKIKTSIEANTAMLRRQMRAVRTSGSTGRVVVSPKTTKNSAQKPRQFGQQTKKKMTAVRSHKGDTQTHQQRQSPPKKAKASSRPPMRQVTRANDKKATLKVTVRGVNVHNSKAQRKQANGSEKVLLPGKVSQALMRQQAPTHKAIKRSKGWKATAGKTTHVVRQPFGQRKKN